MIFGTDVAFLQVNNVLCYFPRLATDVRYKLFRSYCSSIFGCELWHLILWCWHFLHRLSIWFKTCMEFAKYYSQWFTPYDQQRSGYFWWARSLMFIDKCFFHSSDLVDLQFVVRYGVLFGRYKSDVGSNFHFCAARFKCRQSAFFKDVSMLIVWWENTVLWWEMINVLV